MAGEIGTLKVSQKFGRNNANRVKLGLLYIIICNEHNCTIFEAISEISIKCDIFSAITGTFDKL